MSSDRIVFKNESCFTKFVCDCFVKCNSMIIPIVGSYMQRSGVPDRYVIHRAWNGFIEFKFAGGHYRPAQIQVINKMIEESAPVVCLRWLPEPMVIRIEWPSPGLDVVRHDLQYLHGYCPSKPDGLLGRSIIDSIAMAYVTMLARVKQIRGQSCCQ